MSVSAVFPSDAPQMVRPLGNAEQYYVKKSLANTWSNLYLFIYLFIFLILIVTKKLAK